MKKCLKLALVGLKDAGRFGLAKRVKINGRERGWVKRTWIPRPSLGSLEQQIACPSDITNRDGYSQQTRVPQKGFDTRTI